MRRFALQEFAAEPWKNGGGMTRTLFTGPSRDGSAAFDWRVSVAEIAESGPFSRFQDVDRVATVLENGPLRLTRGPALGSLMQPLFVAERHQPLAFPGDLALHGNIGDDPVLCLNVMTRRGAAHATVTAIHADTMLVPQGVTLLFSASDGWLAGGARLDCYQGVLLEHECALEIQVPPCPRGPLIAIVIATQSAPG
ncbi:HutD family protein [Herminiimonas sp.]|uniref:HutD/Ves family protein n=1 Tax=Herminiimonas sp. TaxID=1926289 RepID=UPI002715CF94|nr:HutD family protein [Herminiimonas sp.]MDO8305981.1 HutD family protein [Herminiimonas sp.]